MGHVDLTKLKLALAPGDCCHDFDTLSKVHCQHIEMRPSALRDDVLSYQKQKTSEQKKHDIKDELTLTRQDASTSILRLYLINQSSQETAFSTDCHQKAAIKYCMSQLLFDVIKKHKIKKKKKKKGKKKKKKKKKKKGKRKKKKKKKKKKS